MTEAPALAAGLYLVATPIGNLRDITLRALDTLCAADVIACEDTRTAQRLLSAHGIRRPTLALHDHNEGAVADRLVARIAEGQAVALVSDAGTPLVSDPGYRLVQAALEAGVRVTSLPGPCAAIAALQLAGLPVDRFLFAGFLPAKSGARRRVLEELKPVAATLVFYEAPHRLLETLADAAAVLGPRPATVARELTKLFEEARRGSLTQLDAHYAEAGPPKGEIVLLIGPPLPADAAEAAEDVDTLLRRALATLSVKEAAAAVAAATDRPRRDIYRRALDIAAETGTDA